MNTAEQKKQLRQECLRKRKAMPAEQRIAADRAILTHLLAHPAFRTAKQVFAYVSMPHEVSTRELLTACIEMGKTLALPVCDVKTHALTFYRLDSMEELVTGAYRIPVPPVSADRLCTADAQTLLILPLTAYDQDGYRLGAGGGYYDRFLAANPDLQTVGICYANCKVQSIPREAFDRKMLSCVNENGTEDFHG